MAELNKLAIDLENTIKQQIEDAICQYKKNLTESKEKRKTMSNSEITQLWRENNRERWNEYQKNYIKEKRREKREMLKKQALENGTAPPRNKGRPKKNDLQVTK